MTIRELADRIEQLQPEALPRDVARLCLLLANHVENLDDLSDEGRLCEAWNGVSLRLQSLTDQHAAMTEELELLAQEQPAELSPEGVWALFRAIKTQSRVLDLYVGTPTSAA
jgi:hypothetical protein